MAYSIGQFIADRETSAAAARMVRDRFPDTTLEVLWTDGPQVFVAPAGDWADEVHVAVGKAFGDRPEVRLFPCTTVRGEGGEVVVFARPSWGGAHAGVVLDGLRKTDPEAYAALVRRARKEGC